MQTLTNTAAPWAKYETATMYYFPEMNGHEFTIDAIVARMYASTSYTGPANLPIFVNIYEFNDGANGNAANGILSSEQELTKVAISLDTLAVSTGFNTLVSSNFQKATGGLTTLEANKIYAISYEQTAGLTGANLDNDPANNNMVSLCGDVNTTIY